MSIRSIRMILVLCWLALLAFASKAQAQQSPQGPYAYGQPIQAFRSGVYQNAAWTCTILLRDVSTVAPWVIPGIDGRCDFRTGAVREWTSTMAGPVLGNLYACPAIGIRGATGSGSEMVEILATTQSPATITLGYWRPSAGWMIQTLALESTVTPPGAPVCGAAPAPSLAEEAAKAEDRLQACLNHIAAGGEVEECVW